MLFDRASRALRPHALLVAREAECNRERWAGAGDWLFPGTGAGVRVGRLTGRARVDTLGRGDRLPGDGLASCADVFGGRTLWLDIWLYMFSSPAPGADRWLHGRCDDEEGPWARSTDDPT